MFPEDLGHRLEEISAAAREYLLARTPDCFVDEGLREKCLRLFTPRSPRRRTCGCGTKAPRGNRGAIRRPSPDRPGRRKQKHTASAFRRSGRETRLERRLDIYP